MIQLIALLALKYDLKQIRSIDFRVNLSKTCYITYILLYLCADLNDERVVQNQFLGYHYILKEFLNNSLSMNHKLNIIKSKIMTIEKLITEKEVLSQINYLENNISNGPVSYRRHRLNRIRDLRNRIRNMRTNLRFAS